MHRRAFITAAGSTLALPTWANHGWQPYPQAGPLYLEGEVAVILWSDPHPHLELLHRAGSLPPDLARRRIPPQQAAVDMAALIKRAALPNDPEQRRWRVELPTLARLSAWDMPRPKIKQVIGVVGLPGPFVTGTPTLQAEVLFLGDRAYPMRSDPA